MAQILSTGQRVSDRYVVTGRIGDGGFAEVYEGTDEVLGREVAIKVLRLELLKGGADNPNQILERFKQEARFAAQVGHNNVVTIYDYGIFHQNPFIIMERLYGHDLEDEIKAKGPLDPQRLWPLFCSALDGLGAAHERKVIHKDLKPANLFLVHPDTNREDIRVLDFGVARLDDGDGNTALTSTGQVFGTAKYLAPEYIQNNKNITPALDVYQMGLILVELLTGRAVVDGDNSMACVYKHIKGELDIPTELFRSVLGPTLKCALAINPSERFADAAQFRQALLTIDPLTVPSFIQGSIHEVHTRTAPGDVSGAMGGVAWPQGPGNTMEQSANWKPTPERTLDMDEAPPVSELMKMVNAESNPGNSGYLPQTKPGYVPPHTSSNPAVQARVPRHTPVRVPVGGQARSNMEPGPRAQVGAPMQDWEHKARTRSAPVPALPSQDTPLPAPAPREEKQGSKLPFILAGLGGLFLVIVAGLGLLFWSLQGDDAPDNSKTLALNHATNVAKVDPGTPATNPPVADAKAAPAPAQDKAAPTEATPEGKAPEQEEPSAKTDKDALEKVAAVGGQDAQEAPSEDKAPAAVPTSITLNSNPPGARVRLVHNRKLLGNAPVEIPWKEGEESMEVLVAKSGFHMERITINLKDGAEQTIELKRAVKAAPSGATKRKKPVDPLKNLLPK